MWLRLRLALMCLLMLALPLQGLAAATMLHCGAGHQRLAASAAQHGPDAGPAHAAAHAHADVPAAHDHAGGLPHGHETAVDSPPLAATASDGALPGPAAPGLKTAKIVKCSACAACCVGAVLPSAALVFADFPAALAPAAWLDNPHPDFLADRLDRPPQRLLD